MLRSVLHIPAFARLPYFRTPELKHLDMITMAYRRLFLPHG